MIRTNHDGVLRCDCNTCRRKDPTRGVAIPTKAEVLKLERAFTKASRIESEAIAALPDNPTKAQSDRCWKLADETNKARTALAAALDLQQGVRS